MRIRTNRIRPFLLSLFAVSFLSLTLGARPADLTREERINPVAMPTQCRPGKTSTEAMGWRWKRDARVKIYYLQNNFTLAERGAFARAVENWNRALVEIDSEIVLTVVGEREAVAEDDATVTILRGIPKGKDRLGQLRIYSMSNGVRRATMIISPEVTDLNALTSLMAHEIGHSLGLADCYECRRGSTAMAAFKEKNKGNDVYEPSECDKYVVASGYANELIEQGRELPTGK